MRCSVLNCTNDTKKTTKNHGITFHMFPKESHLRAAWVEALGLTDWEPKERSTVCSEHFRTEDFYQTNNGLRRVRNGAVPVVCHNSQDDLDAPAALRVCRLCLAMDIKMYHIKSYKLNEIYERVTGVMPKDEDRLPQKLCWECAQRLKTCARFRETALHAQSILLEMSLTTSYITIRDIKSVNRTYNNLKSPLIRKIFSADYFDVAIDQDNVKPDIDIGNTKEPIDNGALDDESINGDNVKMEENSFPIAEVEVKNEDSDIFFNEFVDTAFSDSDDNQKLSIFVKPKAKEKKKKLEKKSKVIKRKFKDRDRTKEKEAVKEVKEKLDYEDPVSTTDKYKKTDVKRRAHDDPDESLFTMTTLTYETQIADIQRRQESNAYKNAPYKCDVCFRGFHLRDRYEVHAARHSEKAGAFECFICKSRLKTSRALRKHLTAQHTEHFACKGCPFTTRNRGVAREHARWHAGAKYRCPHCPAEFDKTTTYLGHIRIKHVSDFVCELCGYTFISQKGIDVHKKKKHRLDDKPVVEGPYCEVCDVRFINEEAHGRHLKLSSRHSSDNDPNRIRNDSQSKNSGSLPRSVRHAERRPAVHPRGDRPAPGPVTCEQCGIQLRDLRLYAQHFRRAHPDKNRTKYPAMKTPCMCEQCGRIFQSMALLKDHMWVHTGEKRFKCDRCPKSFTQKTNLVFHLRVHQPSRPSYECPLCGKHFAFFNNRRRHMFIHTGLKPFKCDTCGKCFTTSGEQRAHVEHVHMKKPWPKRARRGAGDGWGDKGDTIED